MFSLLAALALALTPATDAVAVADPDYCTTNPDDCEEAAAACDAANSAGMACEDFAAAEGASAAATDAASDAECDAECQATVDAAMAAADAAGDAAAAEESEPTPSEVWGAHEAMSPARRGEMRCAMLGELIFHEYKRGKTIKTYDLTGEKTEILAGAVAEAIMAEQGISAAWVRALFKQDFEDFTGAMLTDQSSQAVAEKALDDAMAACAPLYASIKVTGDREGSVGALTPLNLPPIAGNEVEAPYCHALFSTFADTMRQKTGRETPESMAFARKAARIRAVLLDKSGRGPEGAATEAMLAAEGAAFDVDAFDALPETDAETIMAACDSFAGPDT